MTDTLIGIFDATQNRPWRGDRFFRVWVANGALRGTLALRDSAASGLWDALALLLLLVVLLYRALRQRPATNRRQRHADLDLNAEEYLQWNKANFRLHASEVERVEFSTKSAWLHYKAPGGKMAVRLTSGETWHFTLPSSADADALQAALDEAGFVTRRAV